MNRPSGTMVSRIGMGGLTWLLGLSTGCQILTCPYHDEFADRAPVTTHSVDIAYEKEAPPQPEPRQREFAETVVKTADGTVLHTPLYFEDSVEDKGSADGKFAWTWEDFVFVPYWRARFVLNAVMFPVSAIVTPPWTVMASDGQISKQALGYCHDAERWPHDAPNDPVDDEPAATP